MTEEGGRERGREGESFTYFTAIPSPVCAVLAVLGHSFLDHLITFS